MYFFVSENFKIHMTHLSIGKHFENENLQTTCFYTDCKLRMVFIFLKVVKIHMQEEYVAETICGPQIPLQKVCYLLL